MRKSNLKLLSLGIFIILMQNSLVAADKNGNTHLGFLIQQKEKIIILLEHLIKLKEIKII